MKIVPESPQEWFEAVGKEVKVLATKLVYNDNLKEVEGDRVILTGKLAEVNISRKTYKLDDKNISTLLMDKTEMFQFIENVTTEEEK